MKKKNEEDNEDENSDMDMELQLAQALALRSILNLDALSGEDEQLEIFNSDGVKVGIVEDTTFYLNCRGFDLDYTAVSVATLH